MNTTHDSLINAANQMVLDTLLAPLSPEAPCGPAARYDAVFTEIRLLREEDDPNLPMGQWERPLKHADWQQIENRCTAMLTTHSKDLQIVVWLVESWMRQRGFIGLLHGLQMLDALLRRYWLPLHPMIDDDGDCEARLAPLEWLNESLSISVRVHAVLLVPSGGKPPHITLADWERITAQEMAAENQPDRKKSDIATVVLTRSDIFTAAQQMGPELALTGAAVCHSLDYLHAIVALLGQHLKAESPNLAKLQNTLEAVGRVLLQLQPEEKASEMKNKQDILDSQCADDGGAALSTDLSPAMATVPSAVVEIANWRNRSEAYATLEALADYLSEVEPHSPTPFLIRRAVNWGRMSLPEVIAEIIREEGDLSRLLNVLGIQS
ncbi:type VI secretion system protein TssA [Glaciimonas sp. GG7]